MQKANARRIAGRFAVLRCGYAEGVEGCNAAPNFCINWETDSGLGRKRMSPGASFFTFWVTSAAVGGSWTVSSFFSKGNEEAAWCFTYRSALFTGIPRSLRKVAQ